MTAIADGGRELAGRPQRRQARGRPAPPALDTASADSPDRGRIGAVDGARGLGLALMLADHVLVVAGVGGWWRLATRPALPLFMVASGAVWRGWRPGRLVEVAVAGLAASALTVDLGFAVPNILLVWLAVQPLMPLVARWPAAAVAAGVLAAVNVPVPWTGYHPGQLVAFLALGRLVPAWPAWLDRGWLAWLGRRPLAVYVGHLGALAVVGAVIA